MQSLVSNVREQLGLKLPKDEKKVTKVVVYNEFISKILKSSIMTTILFRLWFSWESFLNVSSTKF